MDPDPDSDPTPALALDPAIFLSDLQLFEATFTSFSKDKN
jgi:hypothetical protein